MMSNQGSDRETALAELLRKLCEDDETGRGQSKDFGGELDQLTDEELADLLGAGHCLSLLDQIREKQFGSEHMDRIETNPSTVANAIDTLQQSPAPRKSEIPARIGRYDIIRLAAQGGFAQIYLAHDSELDREVALKLPLPGRLESAGAKERFQREGRAVATLSHPAIVPVYEASHFDEYHFIALQWIPGDNLHSYLQQVSQPIPVLDCAAAIERVADAVAHAHSKGILHRDLKPANILLDSDDLTTRPWYKCLKVTDFGLAKNISENPSLESITIDGSILGTPTYMSPEQVRSDPNIESTADVYALGTMLYQLLTGQPPHRKETYSATLRAIEHDPVPPILGLRKNVPGDLIAICKKCLSKNPKDRYHTAFELKSDLERFRQGFPVSVKTPSRFNLATRWIQRNPLIAISLGLTFASLVTGICATTYLWKASLNSQNDLRRQLGIMKSIFEDLDESRAGEVLNEADLRTRMAKNLIESSGLIAEASDEEPLRSSLLSTLGSTLVMLGYPDESFDVISEAIRLADGRVSQDELIDLKIQLSGSMISQGRFKETSELLEGIMKRALDGKSIPDRSKAAAMLTLAESHWAAQKPSDAQREYQRLLDVLPTLKLPERFAQRSKAIADFRLASIHFWDNPSGKLLDTLLAEFQLYKTNFNPDHPFVITAGCAMNSALRAEKRYDEALEMAESSFVLAERKYGLDDSNTMRTIDCILVTCGQNLKQPAFRNRLKEILPFAERSCASLIKKVGTAHPDAIIHYGNVATAYGVLGELDKCIEIERELLALSEIKHGRNSPITQNEIMGLALALKDRGKHKEAIELLTEFVNAGESGVAIPPEKLRIAKQQLWSSKMSATIQGSEK